MFPAIAPLLILSLLSPLLITCATSIAYTHSIPLYHRTYTSTSTGSPWRLRGLIRLDPVTNWKYFEVKDGGGWDSLSFTSVHKSDEDLTTFYQLAIGEDESKRAEDQLLNIILLDSCILKHPKSIHFQDEITVFLSQGPNFEVIHFRYTTYSLEGCHEPVRSEGGLIIGPGREEESGMLKLTIDTGFEIEPVRYAEPVKVVLGTDGKPVVAKTWLQKYWLYALPIVFVLLLPGADEPEADAAKKA